MDQLQHYFIYNANAVHKSSSVRNCNLVMDISSITCSFASNALLFFNKMCKKSAYESLASAIFHAELYYTKQHISNVVIFRNDKTKTVVGIYHLLLNRYNLLQYWEPNTLPATLME